MEQVCGVGCFGGVDLAVDDEGLPEQGDSLRGVPGALEASTDPDAVHLASCAWIRGGQPLCLIGDSGTGKSHLLIGLGTAAAEAGFRVRYTLAAKLVNELVEVGVYPCIADKPDQTPVQTRHSHKLESFKQHGGGVPSRGTARIAFGKPFARSAVVSVDRVWIGAMRAQ